jgi:hypothetical protein
MPQMTERPMVEVMRCTETQTDTCNSSIIAVIRSVICPHDKIYSIPLPEEAVYLCLLWCIRCYSEVYAVLYCAI